MSHQPPIKDHAEVANYLDDLFRVVSAIDDRTSVLADYIKMVDKKEIDPIKYGVLIGRIRNHVGRFLSTHPNCKIQIIDEYNKIQYTEEITHE